MPTRPTFLRSLIEAMPCTTVQKITGAILIKMMIAPVIFCTVVHGIASMSDLKKVGRVGIKTLFYFEAVSTLALAIGLLVGEIWQPGNGFNIDPATLDPKAVATYVTKAKEESIVNH